MGAWLLLNTLMCRTAPKCGEFPNLNVSSAGAKARCLMAAWDPVQHALCSVCVCMCVCPDLSPNFCSLMYPWPGPLSQGVCHSLEGEKTIDSDICPGASRLHHHQRKLNHQHRWGSECSGGRGCCLLGSTLPLSTPGHNLETHQWSHARNNVLPNLGFTAQS